MQASTRSTLAGIFFLGLSIILFEIALTRVFAIMMWHHFTYMVISIGLLGFGASGSLLTATRWVEKTTAPAKALTLVSTAYGVSVMLAFCFATLVRIDSLAIWQQKENFVALFFVYLIIGVPFLLGGMGIGMALTRYVRDVNRLYFGDLVGSALGAGLSVLLMKHFGSSAAVMAAGGFGLLAAFSFSCGAPRRYLLLSLPALLLGAVVVIAFAGGGFGIPAANWRVPFAPGKEAQYLERFIEQKTAEGVPGLRIDRIYSATAEVQVGPELPSTPGIGGDKGLLDDRTILVRSVGQDGTAPTWLFRDAADLAQFPFLDDMQPATAYVAHRAAGRADHDVMVIGVGGGVDVMMALVNGAKHVTAVELNTAMIEMVTQRYADYLGGLFLPQSPHSERISLVNSEGRAWLRSHEGTYDVIQMSGVDSYTALSTGAYTLSESYLYTTGAVQDFYAHLNADGIVNWSRFIEGAPLKPRETLRLANIACTALRELDVADAASHVAVFQGIAWASTMVKKGPFTAVEVQALRDFAAREGFVGLVYDPLRPAGEVPVVEATHFAKLRNLFLDTMARVGGFPPEPERQNEVVFGLQQAAQRSATGATLDAASLPAPLRGEGLAERSLEVLRDANVRGAIDREAAYVGGAIRDFATVLRGSADERARFVADYDYDISPATDDKPFFFNYYRWSSLLGGKPVAHDPGAFTYQTDFPVGHMILLASLAQILLLAGLLIFLPLRRLAHEGLRTPGAWRYFAYFGALGLGFMLLEIALMQKLVIFLGHPTYALSIVLVSLLASAGTGSLLAGRIAEVRRHHVRWILLGIVAVVLLNVLAVNELLPRLLGQSLAVRMGIVVLLLVPTGLVLGMPFPSGMRIVEAQCPQLLPWGWAVNAFFSVFGSIFCIVLSMRIGFTNVLLVAGAVYVVGMLGMRVAGAAVPGAVASRAEP
ncbi:MAG: hypothetical protein JNM25_08565 [Planctomycetes bacterium]|nr:hypothetical protein [Planctomycetota bacterium]